MNFYEMNDVMNATTFLKLIIRDHFILKQKNDRDITRLHLLQAKILLVYYYKTSITTI